MNMGGMKGKVREFFDQKGYIRVRIRKRGKKRSKVRNLRVLSADRKLVAEVCLFLRKHGIKAVVYPIGGNLCIDIEGKHKLERFLATVGLAEGKRKRLEEALKPLSISSYEQSL